jgi:hypothetical protein
MSGTAKRLLAVVFEAQRDAGRLGRQGRRPCSPTARPCVLASSQATDGTWNAPV